MDEILDSGLRAPLPSVLTVANLVYALHTFAIVVGIAGTATVVGSFVGSIPSIAAVILNYARRGDARGTWLESHYRWQIRTFWYSLLWMFLAALVSAPLVLLFGLGILTFYLAATVVGAWVVYRVLRGWVALRGGRTMLKS